MVGKQALFLGAFCLSSSAAFADNMNTVAFDSFRLTGGFGLRNIYSNEFVYNSPSGSRLSQLIWDSKGIKTFDLGIEAEVRQGWTVKANFQTGLGGNGHMIDYDWISPFNAGLGDDQWSDRSLHPDTRLDHLLEAGIEVGKDVFHKGDTNLNLGAGFKYTDVQWTAWGGSFIYSNGGARNDVGNFGATTKVITYRQKLPVIYAGINAKSEFEQWTIGGSLRGGVTVGAEDQDDHWARNLRFIDTFPSAPVLSLSVSLDYEFAPQFSFYTNASFDKIFRVKGDTTTIDTTGATATSVTKNTAGTDYESASIFIGLKAKF
jgi:outer membrane protease